MTIKWPLYRSIEWSLSSGFRLSHLLLAVAVASLIGWQSTNQAIGMIDIARVNVWDSFILAFGGPRIWDRSLVRMMTWYLPQLLFFYFVGDQANGELLQRGYYVVALIGSRSRWWIGKVVSFFLIAMLYTLLYFIATLLVSLRELPWSVEGSALLLASDLPSTPDAIDAWALFSGAYVLFASTIFALTLIQTLIALVSRHSIYGFATVSILVATSWLLGTDNPQIACWLPGTQSILLRHSPFNPEIASFTLGTSLLYNTALAAMAFISGTLYTKRLDIYGAVSTH